MCFFGAVRGYQGLASRTQSEPWWTHTAIISTERTSLLSKYMFIHVLAWHTGFPYRLLSICMHGQHIILWETVEFIKGHSNVFSSSCVVQCCVLTQSWHGLPSAEPLSQWRVIRGVYFWAMAFLLLLFSFSFLFSPFLFSPGYAGEPLLFPLLQHNQVWGKTVPSPWS